MITQADFIALGLKPKWGYRAVGEAGARRVMDVEPEAFTVALAPLLAMLHERGAADVRIEFEPAQAWESCSNPEEIRITWIEGT
jgi:hypothetical protein